MFERSPKRNNQKIDIQTRQKLIQLVFMQKKTIKQAAIQLDIKNSTAKVIVKKFKNTGLMTRFKHQALQPVGQANQLPEERNQADISRNQVSFNIPIGNYQSYLWMEALYPSLPFMFFLPMFGHQTLL